MPCWAHRDYLGECQKELDQVTTLLCEFCQSFEDEAGMPQTVRVWWEKHKELDKKRKEEEQKKVQEKQYLSAKEAATKLWDEIRKVYTGQFAVGVGGKDMNELYIYCENEINVPRHCQFLKKYNGYRVVTRVIGKVTIGNHND